jgi:hypothetical protein
MKFTLRNRRFSAMGMVVLMCTFGMLIWVKLRVVESVPRQAYAEPKRVQREHAPAGFKAGKAPASALAPIQRGPEPAQHATAPSTQSSEPSVGPTGD